MQQDPAGAIHLALSSFAHANEIWILGAHLFCAACVIGSVVAFDLRVLGIGRTLSVRALFALLVPFALLMTLPAAASGAILFALHADVLVGNGAFVLKIVALFAAAINAMIFFTGPYQGSLLWEPPGSIPAGAKFCAALSIGLLALVAFCGVAVATRLASA
jgi:uncharacterized membrane protein YkgB